MFLFPPLRALGFCVYRLFSSIQPLLKSFAREDPAKRLSTSVRSAYRQPARCDVVEVGVAPDPLCRLSGDHESRTECPLMVAKAQASASCSL